MTSPASDFRSDTVTKPTPRMRQAMAEAEVGDDVYGEDPTVRELEEKTATVLGHEAALFVPTGSMGNQLSLRVHARPGTEVILEGKCHIFHYEMAGMAALSGLLPRPVDGDPRSPRAEAGRGVDPARIGLLPPADVRPRAREHAQPRGRRRDAPLRGGAAPRPREGARPQGPPRRRAPLERRGRARRHGGLARGRVRLRDGLLLERAPGARSGSAVAGSKDFIAEARRVRKLFGGGMRQAGVIAAAALVGLEEERSRLPEDHARATKLAAGLASIRGLRIDPVEVETNILLFSLEGEWGDSAAVVAKLSARGVLVGAAGANSIRMVTHADVNDIDVERALRAFSEIAKGH